MVSLLPLWLKLQCYYESDHVSIFCVVPQGSGLGPVLFILLLGLTVKHNREISYHLCAKDIQLYRSVSLFQVY